MIRTALAVVAIAVGGAGRCSLAGRPRRAARAGGGGGGGPGPGAGRGQGRGPRPRGGGAAVPGEFGRHPPKAPALFPDNSKTGGDTAALPAIWENMGDVKGKFDKFGAEAKAAQSSVKDLDSFKSAFGGLTKNCGGCHETYRAKKS